MHVIVNRLARHLRSSESDLYRTLTRPRARAGAPFTIHETRSFDELDRVVRVIAQNTRNEQGGTTCVVLAGGDGSYMSGISALERAFGDRPLPRIALAPGGTVATVARNWGLRGPTEPYAARLLDAIAAGSVDTTQRPTLRVRDERGGDRIGFIFGTGLVSRFFDEYYASPHQGYAGAARIVARIFAGSLAGGKLARKVLSPVPCTLTVDGEPQKATAYSLVVASVVRNLGLSMRVLYRAGDDPSRVHLVASPLGAGQLGPQMPLVLAGKPLRGRDHVDTLAGSFRVTFTGDHDAYVLDGDMLRGRWVEVTAGPSLNLLTARA
ncbi:diacylglycerol/lipid kinase family protein [Pendulispora albinea]|uniref:DAGKc domain-containing protein n=1 Tax=Pendulispora albinea TaxID=2741071 RepID=A0ABZ2MCR5_9BACT